MPIDLQVLENQISFPVEIDDGGPIPNAAPFLPLHDAVANGFGFKPIELLHAIGSKTAALPSSRRDECIHSAHLFLYILEVDDQVFAFRPNLNSDLQSSRSQELGIGMMCLMAGTCFEVPWDQLEAIPGPGRRFDYRATTNELKLLFESKGTKYRYNQTQQIADGLAKKQAHRDRGETFDAAVIISTHVGVQPERPRILVADPSVPLPPDTFSEESATRFRYRHFARAMQFAGFTSTAREIYLRSRYSTEVKGVGVTERQLPQQIERVTIAGQQFVGRYLGPPSNLTQHFGSSKRRDIEEFDLDFDSLSVFQGIREEVYDTILSRGPSEVELRSGDLREVVPDPGRDSAVSVFSDGTVLLVELR